MAKRERYTERSRPHRREVDAGEVGTPGDGNGLKNPVVLIAVGGLVVALVLLVAVFIGRGTGDDETQTAAGATEAAAVEPAEPITESIDAAVDAPEQEPGSEDSAADEGASVSMQQYSAPEDQGLDPENNAYFATVETNKGTIEIELWPGLAPEHVNSFVFLTREGFFDGLTFHRVVDDFVIQGGDPQGTGTGGPGYSLDAEFSDVPHVPGILSMARTDDPNSAGSQFFIVTGEASSLDNQYTVFGYVYEGMDVVYDIVKGDVMTEVTIEEKPASESIVSPDDVRQGNLPDIA